ncbi:putative phosphopantetheinyl transferase [Neohortaea acidophila]|uniref:holo-[acyl-carrier-protein] synthase n=1 Tax=Neohortaea acidophila TaxID=245834 RepID=A0A6A6PZD3_9PEZI|nr:putative phosphopantetheinyl transferase [Neohortaea acidophila]KAF2485136.1 putative phosphopantetheinyl transferase [Neohortaea acidophila]
MITNVTDLQHGYPTPAHSPNEGEVTCWLLDTRDLWPGDNISTAKGAAEALSLVSVQERNAIRGKMFVQDARMSLASALLKRLFISRTLGIKWDEVRMARKGNEKHGKPCAVDNVGRPIAGIDFNVSHQGGLVALIGFNGRSSHEYTPSGMVYGMISPTTQPEEVMCGVDIVCVNERDDYRTIDAEGFDGWVDIYDAVFSGEERWSMKYDVDYVTLYDGTILNRDAIGRHDRCIARDKPLTITTLSGQDYSFSSELILEAKLRRFYTYFCYKESYIKLAGEALLAPWLKQLEFFNVRSPKPGMEARCSTHGRWGEEVEDVEVHMHGRPVSDVRMKIQAFEENFMISTAIQGDIQGLKVPAFKSLNLQSDVLAFARPPAPPKREERVHKRMASDPIMLTSPRRPTITDPLLHTLYTLKDMPTMNDNPYLYAREVPLCLM